MKSDVNLNFRLIVGGNAIHRRDVFKESTNRTIPGACVTLTSKGLLKLFSSLKSKKKSTERGHFNAIRRRKNMA